MDGKQIGYMGVGLFLFVVLMCFGIVLTSSMSYTAREDTTIGLNSITVATNGSLTNFGSSYPYVNTVTDCFNASDATNLLNDVNYTVITGNSAGNGGFVLKDSGVAFVGEDVNCTVSYLKSTTASNSIIALIVIFGTIAGLAVIAVLFMIIRPLIKNIKQ